MKKILSLLVLAIIIICGIYYYNNYNYLIIQGGPIKKSLVINDCKADYIYFITDNRYQVEKTHGHSVNNDIELGQAKTQVAKCLCDSYLNKKNIIDSIEIVEILNSKEYNYVKSIFAYSVEDFTTDTLSIKRICKEKDKYFGNILMD